MSIGAGNGQWVRVRNQAGAESFLAEKAMEQERLAAARKRRHYRYQHFVAAIRRAAQAVKRRLFPAAHRAHNN